MLELITIAIFIAGLLACVALDLSVIFALLLGLVVFMAYGLIRRHSFSSLVKMAWQRVKTTRNVLIVFIMIGALTAVWRACGTIPYIVYHAAQLISPHAFVLAAFGLCCAISLLMGTSFGTAATMGVICMTMGRAMGISPYWLGGAILAGALFGDRCSPMSTSALLVATLTKTDIYKNIAGMLKTAVVPFFISCAVFLAAGMFNRAGAVPEASAEIFAEHFELRWLCVLPAVVIVLMSLLRINVKWTIAVSVCVGFAVGVAVQGASPVQLLQNIVTGYHPEDAKLAAMLGGGGLVSMLLPAGIVCISSCLSGIFDGTGILDSVKRLVAIADDKLTVTGGVIVTAVFSSLISCNQTLAIMLTHNLTKQSAPDDEKLALQLENSAVVISPLVPWSIAGAVPLAAIGAPTLCIVFACYLYLLPLWAWTVAEFRRALRRRRRAVKTG